jgi:methionine sulfoxide reductase heme-binding subunit
MTTNEWIRRVVKPLVFTACLVPLALLLSRAVAGGLGANPISEITHTTGDWTLRFVLITLTVTPLRRLSGWNAVIRLRRMLGLFAFFYGCLHFLTYLVLDQFFDVGAIVKDIAKRPYITIGFTGFLAMIPLALTSTAASIRRLGGRAWERLHRLIYLTAIAGVVHFWWSVKADVRRPQIYAGLATLLLAFRVAAALQKRWSRWPLPAGAASTDLSLPGPHD